MSLHDVSVSAGELAVIIGATAIAARTAHGAYRFIRRLDDMQSLVMKELRPNGGSSLRDAITRIDERVKTLEHRDSPE